jgi:hypothetical protein
MINKNNSKLSIINQKIKKIENQIELLIKENIISNYDDKILKYEDETKKLIIEQYNKKEKVIE